MSQLFAWIIWKPSNLQQSPLVNQEGGRGDALGGAAGSVVTVPPTPSWPEQEPEWTSPGEGQRGGTPLLQLPSAPRGLVRHSAFDRGSVEGRFSPFFISGLETEAGRPFSRSWAASRQAGLELRVLSITRCPTSCPLTQLGVS